MLTLLIMFGSGFLSHLPDTDEYPEWLGFIGTTIAILGFIGCFR